MAYGVIYRITCKLDGMIYIGQTTRSIEVRFKEHARCKGTYVGRAIQAYGEENFTCEVIEECDTREQLNEREIFWIAELNCKRPNGYNLTDGGEGVEGFHCSEETKAKMSASHKGLPKSPETRAKLSASKIGEKNPFFGKKLSPEHRAKIGAAGTGRKNSPETKAKMSASQIGHEVSAKTAVKISIRNRGETLFKNLQNEMDARQLSYTALAKLINLSQPAISDKMRGKRNFTAEQIAKLVEIFDRPAEYLMARD